MLGYLCNKNFFEVPSRVWNLVFEGLKANYSEENIVINEKKDFDCNKIDSVVYAREFHSFDGWSGRDYYVHKFIVLLKNSLKVYVIEYKDFKKEPRMETWSTNIGSMFVIKTPD